jgi:hypothetical protein
MDTLEAVISIRFSGGRVESAIVNDRPGLSSEKAPQINKPATVRQ